jgi:hypothetical protein
MISPFADGYADEQSADKSILFIFSRLTSQSANSFLSSCLLLELSKMRM